MVLGCPEGIPTGNSGCPQCSAVRRGSRRPTHARLLRPPHLHPLDGTPRERSRTAYDHRRSAPELSIKWDNLCKINIFQVIYSRFSHEISNMNRVYDKLLTLTYCVGTLLCLCCCWMAARNVSVGKNSDSG